MWSSCLLITSSSYSTFMQDKTHNKIIFLTSAPGHLSFLIFVSSIFFRLSNLKTDSGCSNIYAAIKNWYYCIVLLFYNVSSSSINFMFLLWNILITYCFSDPMHNSLIFSSNYRNTVLLDTSLGTNIKFNEEKSSPR